MKKPSNKAIITRKMVDEDDLLDSPGDISASEDEGDQEKHEKLLDAIAELDGKKRKRKDLRIEPSTQVSEFNLATAASDNQVVLHELVGVLKDTGSKVEIRKKLKSAKAKKVLPAPLNKLEQERVERTLVYEQNQKEVSKWLPIVQKNRQAEQLHFPLVTSKLKLETTDKLVQKFQPRTPLELEVAKMLHGSDHVLSTERMLTRSEERALKAMNLEEAKARRAELQKYRALLSYKEAKARRQNKIKSKKYHRILRKETLKRGRRAFEDLKASDPEGYAEKLKLLEKDRIQERMSLKHKGGSKYMAKQMLYGKYNKEARDNVQEMIKKNKELTTKLSIESESESESEGLKAAPAIDQKKNTMFSPWTDSTMSGANPWMEPVKAQTTSSFKRPETLVNKEAEDETEEDLANSVSIPVNNDLIYRESKLIDVRTTQSDVESSGSEADETALAQPSNDTVGEELLSDSESDCIEIISEHDLSQLFDVLEDETNRPNKPSKDIVNRKRSKANDVIKEEDEKLKKKRKKKKNKKKVVEEECKSSDEDNDEAGVTKHKVEIMQVQDDGEELMTSSLLRKQTLEQLGDWSDSETVNTKRPKFESSSVANMDNKDDNSSENKDISIDPKCVLTVQTKIKNSLASNVISDEEEDYEAAQRMTIGEAFVDDDVMADFSKDKQAVIDRDKPKDLDLTLPGWGDWGGGGIVISRKKRKRFRVKAVPAPPRKDRNLDNVILSEAKDNSIAKHQVNNLPFAFNNVKQFESSVRAPIGKTWNPETSFRELTKPKVLTRPGMIIEPMEEGEKYKKQKEKAFKPNDVKNGTKKTDKSKKRKHKK